ncbi:hypothetical protein GUJ93_ZPchr0006g45365 [Zizania palustris]|uniref:Uncharacterized protein n=1 Tax=Zizania palustris TaxID=103762 RepID=A0A8J5VLN8_ZIZPA|nr:hypothetical protein GUJ93_ZPchr0006g45365 [Zizania palustris]
MLDNKASLQKPYGPQLCVQLAQFLTSCSHHSVRVARMQLQGEYCPVTPEVWNGTRLQERAGYAAGRV